MRWFTLPFFFITGSAGNGKSFIILVLLEYFQRIGHRYLLMASTGIAAQNIGGTKLHSALRITLDERGFRTLIFRDPKYCNNLCLINTLIIEEVSMVSGPLLTYTSELFEHLHQNNYQFGGVNVILIGDLAQLHLLMPHMYINPLYGNFFILCFFVTLKDKIMIPPFMIFYKKLDLAILMIKYGIY